MDRLMWRLVSWFFRDFLAREADLRARVAKADADFEKMQREAVVR